MQAPPRQTVPVHPGVHRMPSFQVALQQNAWIAIVLGSLSTLLWDGLIILMIIAIKAGGR